MNRLERFIYDKVRFSPKLKNNIVKIYQNIFSRILQKSIKSDYAIDVREGYFYGFHDKCPWSPDNQYLLAHKYKFDLKMPNGDDLVEIGYFENSEPIKFIKVAETRTWNWQMGSMLQWIGKDRIIYNDFNGKDHVAKIVDMAGAILYEISKPIACITNNGKHALSHGFTRLQKAAPAYSYANGRTISDAELLPQTDGIFLIDMKKNQYQLLFSLADIAVLEPEKYAPDSYHYFTHCLFSPSGKRFAFYHRWVESNGQTWTRLFTCNIDGSDIHKFDFSGVVTHLAWRDDTHLSAYGLKEKIGDHFYLLQDQTQEFEIIGQDAFSSDGHQQFSPDGKFMLTDTYPDRFRRQYLIKYNLESNFREDIAVLKSPLKYTGDIRCDLHPRWDRTGTMIAFDSAHTGKRSLCTVKIS